jgi:hypothetical protein
LLHSLPVRLRLTEPVTANDCLIGTSDSAERSAYSSAAEALSPSTGP